MMCIRALLGFLSLCACIVHAQKKRPEKTNVFTMRPVSTIYLPHGYRAGKALWGLNKDAAVQTAYDMDTKLAYSAGKKWIHVVDFADVHYPKILDKFESPRPLTDIKECGQFVAWAIEGEQVTDPGMVVLYNKFSRGTREWTKRCEFQVGSKPKSIKFTRDCSTIVVANEGEAAVAGQGSQSQWVNPEGSVSIIRLYGNRPNRGQGGGPNGGNPNGGNPNGGRNAWGNGGQGGGQGGWNQGGGQGARGGQGWNGRGQNTGGQNWGGSAGGGWNNRGQNTGQNAGGTGWNQNTGGGGWNQNGGGTGWNQRGQNTGGAGWNNQGQTPRWNSGGNGWNNRGQNTGRPNNGNPNWQGGGRNGGNPSWQGGQGGPSTPSWQSQGQGTNWQGTGQSPWQNNNSPRRNPGQGPRLLHELAHLRRQKRQFPPPPQTPRWQPPQRPTFPQTPARGPGRVPGMAPNRPWQNPGQQNPQQGVTFGRGTCSGGGGFNPIITTLDFTKFNPSAELLTAQLVRQPYKGQMGDKQENTFSQGLEPEYVTLDPTETTAYVSLQENNAIASVDLRTNQVTGIHPLGAKQWKRYDLDPSPGNGRTFKKYDIESFRQPDAIETYRTSNGDTFVITANEGKQLEYTCNLHACPPGGGEFVEFEKGDEFPEDYWLTDKLLQRVTNEEMLDAFRLGNLEFSRIDGRSTEQPLKHDNVYFYGGRGISAYRVDRRTGNLTLAWDSGDIIEKATAKYLPKIHNGNNRVGDPSVTMASTFDSRSDQRGPECESLAIGDVQGTKLIFVGIDRVSAIAIFSVTKGQSLPIFESITRDGHIDKSFSELYRTKRFGDSDPESLTFIPPEKTIDQRPYLLVTGRVSGTVTLYQIRDEPIWMLLKDNPNSDVRQLASLPVVLLSAFLGLLTSWRRIF
ncbi:mesenchyme-specific cell surface glycoprotein-like [Diadema antillarum]|uniref:mesenchyme-specific cell surface glycoprotein-like n=1 Tax=Diadema antillarum TaxID=105358 RepID=UPI003A853C57